MSKKEEPIDVESELTKILQEELKKVWDETPLGYNKMNDAYHVGKGIMVTEEGWNGYLEAREDNPDLDPLDYMVSVVREEIDQMKKDEEDGMDRS